MPTDKPHGSQREALERLAERPLYISRLNRGLSVATGTARGLETRGWAYRRRRPDGVEQLVITDAGRRAWEAVENG